MILANVAMACMVMAYIVMAYSGLLSKHVPDLAIAHHIGPDRAASVVGMQVRGEHLFEKRINVVWDS